MKIYRGDIWLINLNPIVGSEIAKTRPAVIVSHSKYNLAASTATIIPISTGRFLKSFHVQLEALKDDSHAIIPQIRVADKKQFIKKIGRVTTQEMLEIESKLSKYLDLRK